MYSYMCGTIKEIGLDTIVLEVNQIGYQLFISHQTSYKLDEFRKIHVYLAVKEDGMTLYGFSSKEEKELFLRLINVSGIGPKTAIHILGATSVEGMIQAIETSNTGYLKKLPGIGPKSAQQIILDLKGKLTFDAYDTNKNLKQTNQNMLDAKEALKSFGFKNNEIDSALAKLNGEVLSSEEYLKRCLQMLRK